jgi:L-serine dehydratase
MAVELYPNLNNDFLDPLVQPGPGSHMAAPCRVGYLAGCLRGEPP